jgi:hypothetical protein
MNVYGVVEDGGEKILANIKGRGGLGELRLFSIFAETINNYYSLCGKYF